MTEKELIALLTQYHIPFQNWGTGNAKTLSHLLKELNLGESKLIEQNNQLLRLVQVIVLDVYYQEDKKLYIVKEDRQVYKNGRIVKRGFQNSVLEKLLPDEDPESGVKRALAEELGIMTEVSVIEKGTKTERITNSINFPGLTNESTFFNYEAHLNNKQYKKEGYQEIQEDKTSYFIWEEVTKK